MSSSSRAIPIRCVTAVSCALRPIDFLVNLKPFFPNDGKLGLEDLPARFKDIMLRGEDGRDRGRLVPYGLHPGRKQHPLVTLLLGLEPCFTRHRVPQLTLQALHFGAGLGVVQPDQYLSGSHSVAVGDQNFPDDAALEMLDRLPAQFRFHDAGSDSGALEWREGGPNPETQHKADNQQIACQGDAAKPGAERRLRGVTWTGNLLVCCFVLGLGTWSTYAPLESAAIAAGAVESEVEPEDNSAS